MFEMFIVVYLFGKIFKKTNALIATLIAVLLNGPVSGIVSGWVVQKVVGGITAYKFFLLMVIPLTLATFVNVFLAYLVYRVMKNVNY
jgi:biotin transporter BioY